MMLIFCGYEVRLILLDKVTLIFEAHISQKTKINYFPKFTLEPYVSKCLWAQPCHVRLPKIRWSGYATRVGDAYTRGLRRIPYVYTLSLK